MKQSKRKKDVFSPEGWGELKRQLINSFHRNTFEQTNNFLQQYTHTYANELQLYWQLLMSLRWRLRLWVQDPSGACVTYQSKSTDRNVNIRSLTNNKKLKCNVTHYVLLSNIIVCTQHAWQTKCQNLVPRNMIPMIQDFGNVSFDGNARFNEQNSPLGT